MNEKKCEKEREREREEERERGESIAFSIAVLQLALDSSCQQIVEPQNTVSFCSKRC